MQLIAWIVFVYGTGDAIITPPYSWLNWAIYVLVIIASILYGTLVGLYTAAKIISEDQ
jgi:hypothetical protein